MQLCLPKSEILQELKTDGTIKYDIFIAVNRITLNKIQSKRFLAFCAANLAIMSSTSIFRRNSCSIDKRVRLFKRS